MIVKLKGQPPEEFTDITRMGAFVFYKDDKGIVNSSFVNVNLDADMLTSLGNYMLRIGKAVKEGRPIPKMYQDVEPPKQLGNRIITPPNNSSFLN